MSEIATYQVSLKLLLRNGDEFLILQDTYKNFLDLPGGRINDDEFTVPIEDILRREVTEELGADICYEIQKPLFQVRRFHNGLKMPILLTIYGGIYKSGGIALSDEHAGYDWVHRDNFLFQIDRFYNKEECDVMHQYFDTLKSGSVAITATGR